MGLRTYIILLVILTMCGVATSSSGLSIPSDKQDVQKIFYGVPEEFEKPARVNYQDIVKATPEYSSIKKKKIVSGSAKYWILISKASERAQKLIKEVGEETPYDLIVADGYLESLEPAIPAEDVTELVLEKLK
jgi:hypothetical protein